MATGFPIISPLTQSSGWTVAFGTGVGFAAPKPILSQAARFELSLEKVGCFPRHQRRHGRGAL